MVPVAPSPTKEKTTVTCRERVSPVAHVALEIHTFVPVFSSDAGAILLWPAGDGLIQNARAPETTRGVSLSLSRHHRGGDSYRLLLLWTPPGVSSVRSSSTVARGGQRRERGSGKMTREARLSPGERTVRREKEVVDATHAWPGGRMGGGNDSLTWKTTARRIK